ncbi:hypothetical protein CYY_010238 [Polysphondylium violaceum]|uniref:Coatomer subunit delta n=1 Tax=Polysphondylium violaceum TaxID=133409 RepID=A0A8J4PK72_9MYCE|nr:hypothetical protein CYY_010238 [Polysphondylium violaceum]
MVVLAAAICTKNGKPLLSRQFSEMTKSRVEGLLSAFPKLIGTGKQHTFIETENIRYVYQPLESLYIVLITNKNSNILEDLETLHLLAKLVPEYANFDEHDISRKAFELVFTFDEVIAMGYKERVNVQQIKTFISMESHEEERARKEEQMREKEAKNEGRRKIKELEKIRAENIVKGGRYAGIGSGSGGYIPVPTNSSERNPSSSPTTGYIPPQPHINTKQAPGKEGMKLSKATNKNSAIAQVLKEERVVEKVEDVAAHLDSSPNQLLPTTPAIPQEGVHITIEEEFMALVENDGTVDTIDIKGGLLVTINDSNISKIKIPTAQGPLARKSFQFNTHPLIDKQLFVESNLLKLKDPSRGFPSTGILKWRCKTTDDSMIPLKVSCWPSPGRDSTTVNMEYESLASFELKNIQIFIPNPSASSPIVNNIDGLYEYNTKEKMVVWKIPMIDDTNRTGSMEFTVKGNSSNFYPLSVFFNATTTMCDISIKDVLYEDSNESIRFSSESTLSVDKYEINN